MCYTVILERESDGGYVVGVPALPRCVSQGDSRAEALSNIREAIGLYIEDCRAKTHLPAWSCPTIGQIRQGTLRRIIADAGLTVDEFIGHLSR